MEKLQDIKGKGESDCCGAGTYGENMICEDCGEHCGEKIIEFIKSKEIKQSIETAIRLGKGMDWGGLNN